MTMLKARPYQVEANDAVRRAWDEGFLRPAVVLPTGAGKTVTFAHLIAQENKRTVVLVHRDELAKQAADKLRSVAPDLDIGIVKAEMNQVESQVVVASIQTLYRQTRLQQLLDAGKIGLVVYDECFPAGTKVGSKNIEDLRPGDLVPSWDEKTGRYVERPVTHVMSRVPSSMVRVTLDDGTHFDCTPNHPIMTDQGWNSAGLLQLGESVVSFVNEEDRSSVLQVREDDGSRNQISEGCIQEVRPDFLFGRVSEDRPEQGILRENVQNESQIRVRTHEAKEPDARSGCSGEDGGNPSVHRSSSEGSRRQRIDDAPTSEDFSGSLRTGLGDGVFSRNLGRRVPEGIPLGYSSRPDEDLRGGGRWIPLLTGTPSLRPSQGREVVVRRVENVQVLQPGRDGTYSGVCPDGLVYNIEVADTHTYLINDGIIAHNCHHAVAPANMSVLEQLGVFEDVRCVGFTATMNRSDDYGLGDVWQDVVYKKDILWGIINGFLVDVEAEAIKVDGFSLADIAKKRGDYQEGKLGDALVASGAGDVVAREYKERAGKKQGIVFCPTVACAEDFLGWFEEHGIRSALIVGTTTIDDRQQIYKQYEAGEVQVLVSVMALTEGFDMPQAEVAVIARPTMSQSLYVQMVGRVLRLFPGKTKALVLDVVGAGAASLSGIIDLSETKVAPMKGESLLEAAQREQKETENLERDVVQGTVTSKVLDLFKQSSTVWLRTKGGLFFIPTKECYVFLWPTPEGFKVGRTGTLHSMKGGHYLKEEPLSLPFAMAWGEQFAEEIDPSTSQRSAPWRRKKSRATDAQKGLADRLRIRYSENVTKDEMSDLISIHLAGKIFDKIKR